jgi:hypothetical protein
VRDNLVVNRWNFDWRRELFVRKSDLLHNNIVRLEEVVFRRWPGLLGVEVGGGVSFFP